MKAAGALIGLPRELRHNIRAIYYKDRNGATLQTLCSRLRSGFFVALRSVVVRARLIASPGPFVIGLDSFRQS